MEPAGRVSVRSARAPIFTGLHRTEVGPGVEDLRVAEELPVDAEERNELRNSAFTQKANSI